MGVGAQGEGGRRVAELSGDHRRRDAALDPDRGRAVAEVVEAKPMEGTVGPSQVFDRRMEGAPDEV